MAKKDLLKSNLIKKKPVIQEKEASRVVSKIHTSKGAEEATVKTSVDFRKSLYKAMKMKLLEDELTMREYLEKLIEADLNK